jgi:hypothetical protein
MFNTERNEKMEKKALLNQTCCHKKFGDGLVTEISTELISIDFPNEGEKKFVYPDAFQDYLKMQDTQLEDFVTTELTLKKEAEETKKAEQQRLYDELQTAKKSTKKTTKRKTKKTK